MSFFFFSRYFHSLHENVMAQRRASTVAAHAKKYATNNMNTAKMKYGTKMKWEYKFKPNTKIKEENKML